MIWHLYWPITASCVSRPVYSLMISFSTCPSVYRLSLCLVTVPCHCALSLLNMLLLSSSCVSHTLTHSVPSTWSSSLLSSFPQKSFAPYDNDQIFCQFLVTAVCFSVTISSTSSLSIFPSCLIAPSSWLKPLHFWIWVSIYILLLPFLFLLLWTSLFSACSFCPKGTMWAPVVEWSIWCTVTASECPDNCLIHDLYKHLIALNEGRRS